MRLLPISLCTVLLVQACAAGTPETELSYADGDDQEKAVLTLSGLTVGGAIFAALSVGLLTWVYVDETRGYRLSSRGGAAILRVLAQIGNWILDQTVGKVLDPAIGLDSIRTHPVGSSNLDATGDFTPRGECTLVLDNGSTCAYRCPGYGALATFPKDPTVGCPQTLPEGIYPPN